MVESAMKTNRRKFVRRGAAVVEAAVVAPLMILAMLGMVEVGYAFMVKQNVTLAAREGARAGALPGADSNNVHSAVSAAMTAANLSGYTTTTNIAELGVNDVEVWVEVRLPLNRVSFTGQLLGGGSFDITGRATMRREGISPEP